MINMADSFTPPSDAALGAASGRISAWWGYLGGPSAATRWPPEAFARIRRSMPAPGIYVGLGSAQEAITLGRACLLPGDIIAHDIETDYDVRGLNDATAGDWAGMVRRAGFRPVLYGLPALCARFGHWYDGVWVAGGPAYRDGGPVPPDPYGLGTFAPGRQAWQWYGSHGEFGTSIDSTIADPWFVEVELMGLMNLDVARTVGFLTRKLALNNVGTQQDVDFLAQKLADPAQNVEQVLTEFCALVDQDAGSLWNRINSLQNQITQMSSGGAAAPAGLSAVQDQLNKIRAGLASASQA